MSYYKRLCHSSRRGVIIVREVDGCLGCRCWFFAVSGVRAPGILGYSPSFPFVIILRASYCNFSRQLGIRFEESLYRGREWNAGLYPGTTTGMLLKLRYSADRTVQSRRWEDEEKPSNL